VTRDFPHPRFWSRSPGRRGATPSRSARLHRGLREPDSNHQQTPARSPGAHL